MITRMLMACLVLAYWCLLPALPVRADDASPLLYLSFEQGLTAANNPEVQGKWAGKTPPQYFDAGLIGKALLLGDVNDATVNFDAPPSMENTGAILFWVKGLENWHLYKMHNAGGRSSFFFNGGGPKGWATITRWNYDTSGVKLMIGTRSTSEQQIFFPKFDQYQWTQIGFTYDHDRVRLYLNGNLVKEATNFPLAFTKFSFGGNQGEEGCRRLLDEVKVFDKALAPSDIKRIYRRDLAQATLPKVTAPPLTTLPTIDGVMKAGEWDGCASVRGLLNKANGERSADESTFFLGYDATHLYVAMQGDLTELARTRPEQVAMNGFLQSTRTKHDEDTDADDAVDLLISPTFWSGKDWTEYRMVANSAGVLYDYYSGPDGLKLAWDPDWRSASSVNPEGWQFEAAIPLEVFGGQRPTPGAEWALQLTRIWKQLKAQWDVWGWGLRQADGNIRLMHMYPITGHRGDMFGTMRFGGAETPVVRVDRTSALENKAVDWAATLINPSAQETKVRVKLFTDAPEIAVDKTLTLPARGEATFTHQHTLTNFSVSAVSFEVSTEDGKTLLHRTHLPFHLQQSLGMLVRRYPSDERFRVELDLGMFSTVPLNELRVDLAINGADGKPVWQQADTTIDGYTTTIAGSTKAIAPGDYTLNLAIRQGKTVLANETRPFVKKSLPAWFNNTYGEGPKVPTPFLPITVDTQADALSLWGRTYTYGGNLFPAQITTQGRAVLAAPITLAVTGADGKETVFANAGKVQWTKTTDKRVEFTRMAEANGIRVQVDGWAEYDGLNWYTLKVSTVQPMTVRKVTLRMPYATPFSELMNVYDYGLAESGIIPKDGYAMSPRPLWLGDAKGGMQWITENTAGWTLANQKTGLQIAVGAEGATVQANLVDSPLALQDKPVQVAFGLNATPVRPPFPQYRLINRSDHPVALGGGAWAYQQRFNPSTLHRWNYYAETKPKWREDADSSSQHIASGVYYTSSGMYPDNEDYAYWGDEWSHNPNFVYVKDPTITNPAHRGDVGVCQAAKSWQDYTVWHYAKLFEETACRGVYADDGPAFCNNPHHGHAEPKHAILGYREIIRRIYEVLREKYPDQTYNMLHQSGQRNMAYSAFYDVYATGENFSSKITMSQPHYADHMRLDAFKAEALGHNFGPTCWFLTQLHNVRGPFREQYGEERSKWYGPWSDFVLESEQYIEGMVLLHDSTLWPGWSPEGQVKRFRQALRTADFGDAYTFVPYWEQTITPTLPDGAYASFYVDAARKRVLLVYLNSTTNADPVRLTLDWTQLGLDPAKVKAENLVHAYQGEQNWARIEGNAVVFSSGARNFRLIYLTQP
jgi:hypothetical protein